MNDKACGLGVSYYANGNPLHEGLFGIKGLIEGKEYYPNGQLRCYGHYKINKGYGPNNIINGTWYSEERIGKLAVARQTHNDELLKESLTAAYKTDINKACNKMIRDHALKVGVTTAISQNEKIDTLFVVIYNLSLIKDIIFLYGFRPNDRQLSKIYRSVIGDAIIAYGLGNATGSMASGVVKKMGKGLDGIPLIGSAINTVIDSLAQGVINSTLTVMIGIQTKKYLLKEYKLQNILDDVIISETELENEAKEMSSNLKEDIKEQSKKESKNLQTA